MAEHLRLVGDLTVAEISGPMNALLIELRRNGSSVTIELAGVVGTVAMDSRRTGTTLSHGIPGRGRAPPERQSMTPATTIVRRFLGTRALIGLAELTARYPISSAEATELLDRWSEEGKVVRTG